MGSVIALWLSLDCTNRRGGDRDQLILAAERDRRQAVCKRTFIRESLAVHPRPSDRLLESLPGATCKRFVIAAQCSAGDNLPSKEFRKTPSS